MLKIFLVSVDIGFLGNSKRIKVINFLLFRSTSGHQCDFSEKQLAMEVAQLGKGLSLKHMDPSSTPRTHIKNWVQAKRTWL